MDIPSNKNLLLKPQNVFCCLKRSSESETMTHPVTKLPYFFSHIWSIYNIKANYPMFSSSLKIIHASNIPYKYHISIKYPSNIPYKYQISREIPSYNPSLSHHMVLRWHPWRDWVEALGELLQQLLSRKAEDGELGSPLEMGGVNGKIHEKIMRKINGKIMGTSVGSQFWSRYPVV